MPAGWFPGVEAASLPRSIGVTLQETHDRWARALAVNLASASGIETPH